MLGTKMLIIDDDVNICELIKVYFQNEGYDVAIANDGVEGMAMFKSYDPDTGRMVGEIVNVSADESVLNEDGVVCPYKLRPVLFDSMNKTYLAPGEVVGYAFKDGFLIK